MAMKPLYDLTVKTGSYTDRDGQQKVRYLNIGKAFQRDDGSLTLKLDCLPVGIPEWNGWVNCYAVKTRNGDGYNDAAPKPQPRASDAAYGDEDLPF